MITKPTEHGSTNSSAGVTVETSSNNAVKDLISGIRSINFGRHHLVEDPDGEDDEPRYWQRQEWIEWVLDLAKLAEVEMGVSDKTIVSTINQLSMSKHKLQLVRSEIERNPGERLTSDSLPRRLVKIIDGEVKS